MDLRSPRGMDLNNESGETGMNQLDLLVSESPVMGWE